MKSTPPPRESLNDVVPQVDSQAFPVGALLEETQGVGETEGPTGVGPVEDVPAEEPVVSREEDHKLDRRPRNG